MHIDSTILLHSITQFALAQPMILAGALIGCSFLTLAMQAAKGGR